MTGCCERCGRVVWLKELDPELEQGWYLVFDTEEKVHASTMRREHVCVSDGMIWQVLDAPR